MLSCAMVLSLKMKGKNGYYYDGAYSAETGSIQLIYMGIQVGNLFIPNKSAEVEIGMLSKMASAQGCSVGFSLRMDILENFFRFNHQLER